jgi:hypothetical protein
MIGEVIYKGRTQLQRIEKHTLRFDALQRNLLRFWGITAKKYSIVERAPMNKNSDINKESLRRHDHDWLRVINGTGMVTRTRED